VKITREVVLQGVIRHTVDARHRTEDGLNLFEQFRYGGAIILGTIAVEDIGRAYWLVSLADDSSRLGKLNVQSLNRELRNINHHEGLKLGLRSLSVDNAPTISSTILGAQYDDWEDVLAQNLKAISGLHKRSPARIHDSRTDAQYPKLNEAGFWRSSTDIEAATAKDTLRQAAENLYVLQTFCLKNVVGLRELSKELGTEDVVFDYLEPYKRLGMID
jgi:hypothetical protein